MPKIKARPSFNRKIQKRRGVGRRVSRVISINHPRRTPAINMKPISIISLVASAICYLFGAATHAFVSPSISIISHHRQRHQKALAAVTEEQVIQQVDRAEEAWAQALEARKEANALSDRAEENAEAAAEVAREADAAMREGAISLEKIAKADQATSSNLDASSILSRALQAAEEADRLEEIAEEALAKSEEMLEQHLVDFPDSPLA